MSIAQLAPTRPVADVLGDLHRLVDELTASMARASKSHLADQIPLCHRATTRLRAAELAMISAAARDRVAERAGHAGTDAWLAQATHTTGRDAARSVKLAEALTTRLPVTQRALAEGALSADHAHVIDQIDRELPTGLGADQRSAIETELVAQSAHLDPAALRRRGRRALEIVASDPAVVDAHEDRVLGSEESQAWERTRLTLHDNGDGTTSGHFTVPTLAGAILHKVLHALASPRRARPGAAPAQAGEACPEPAGPAWDRRLGQAFAEILEQLPTDRLAGKTAATVVVTLDHQTLIGALAAAAIDTGEAISGATARRLACEAGIVPAVLGGQSQALDLGRSKRFFSEAQRTALAARYASCAADGCDRPLAWCHLHHRQPWSAGGTTNLADAVPLCGFHHRRIHDPDYEHRESTGHRGRSVVTFRRR